MLIQSSNNKFPLWICQLYAKKEIGILYIFIDFVIIVTFVWEEKLLRFFFDFFYCEKCVIYKSLLK